ncbi:MAG: class I SAM-dependent methyltransferase [Alphaproteobacteria bacterium]
MSNQSAYDFVELSRRGLKHLLGRNEDSFDILEVAFLKAALDSASYYESRMRSAPAFATHLDLLSHALGLAHPGGLVLEFGVGGGGSITHIAAQVGKNRTVFGFDSFEGLPEVWRTGFEKGAFAQSGPPTVPDSVHLIEGKFADTLPAFLRTNQDPVGFIHVDCDLHSSTQFLLNALAPRIHEGCIIVFDEYFNFPGWRHDEFKAFQEFVATHSISYDYIGFVPSHQQAAVRIAGRQRPA